MRSDTTLAERFAAGDETAFDVIYERHRSVVLAVSMGVLGTTQDAEDATQETFSALAVALRNKPPAELRPWLIRVARNASIDTTRRRRHRLLTLDGEIPEIPARQASAGQAELAVVLDGIRELPEGQRMALLMRELGGHSYTEIADFLETDEEAVKGLIARARVGLRTYREATEFPCATARSAIAAEPDGRRYDKTIRRHLRTCASCRSYRAALRDDAKVLRAALPLQTGSVATGGISTGMLTAAKGTLIGYGLTQAATTCAASACAVGAIGGMVFITPVHRLGLPPIIPATKTAPAPKHVLAKPVSKPAVAAVSTHSASRAVSATATATAGLSAAHHKAKKSSAVRDATHRTTVARHHHHALTVTKVKLPTLRPGATTNSSSTGSAPAASTLTPASTVAPTSTAATPQTPTTAGSSAVTTPTTTTTASYGNQPAANQGTQGSGSTGSAGYGASWAWAGSSTSTTPTTTTSTTTTTTSATTTTTSTQTSTLTTPTSTLTTPGAPTQTGTGGYGVIPPSGVVHTGGWQNGSYAGGTTTPAFAPSTVAASTTTTDATTDTTDATTDTTGTTTTSQATGWSADDGGWGN